MLDIELPFECNGIFWKPENSSQRVAGTLKITKAGEISLLLISAFPSDPQDRGRVPRLIGQLASLTYVTLERCLIPRHTIGPREVSDQSVWVESAVFGAYYKPDVLLKSHSLMFSVHGLSEWINKPGAKWLFPESSCDGHFLLEYRCPENVDIALSNGSTLRILFSFGIDDAADTQKTAVHKKVHFVLFAKDMQFSIEELLKTATRIKEFMALALNHPVDFEEVKFLPVLDDLEFTTEYLKLGAYCDYVFCPSHRLKGPIKPILSRATVAFYFDDIADRISSIINSWLDRYEQAEPVFSLYFTYLFNPDLRIHFSFLALAQAIENYHRTFSNRTKMPQEKFSELAKTLLSACPKEHRNFVESKLQYANEIPLRSRVSEMIDQYTEEFGGSDRAKKFVGQFCDTRNYLTHFNEKLASTSCEGVELLRLVYLSEMLLLFKLLELIGFEPKQIKEMAQKNWVFHQKLSFDS
ncbi:MAG: hypothetical protein U0894_13770 [Pirellulales bacterium]